jgi:hypothetical protein
MRVRTTWLNEAPASTSASSMIRRQRRACTSASGSQLPSGHTGAVPETSTRSSTAIARLKPMRGSYGDPDEIRVRGLTG